MKNIVIYTTSDIGISLKIEEEFSNLYKLLELLIYDRENYEARTLIYTECKSKIDGKVASVLSPNYNEVIFSAK